MGVKAVLRSLVVGAVLVALLGSTVSAATGSNARESSSAALASSVDHLSTGVSTAHSALSPSVTAALTQRARDLERASGLPASLGLEPNVGYSTVREGSLEVPANIAGDQVSPGPTSIGVNDLGFRSNSAGALEAYSYRTTSLDGTVTINNMSLLPVMTNASNAITVQENAVLNNVTLFGKSVYQIWAQNVIFYSVTGDQLQLLTDGWNFTGPPVALYQNDIYENSPGGYLFGGVYVHQVPLKPPAFTVRMPFTIRLYLNATNIDGRNALFFNYTLSSKYNITLGSQNFGTSINRGSFDWIIFNSTAGKPKSYRAPPASFLISGSQPSGIGLPNDAEIAICGPSDGFSAVARSLNATAQLLYLDSATGDYAAVPAAFTTTEDTGESVEGVDAHFTAASAAEGIAYLTSGPEFIYGLWNATASDIHDAPFAVRASPASTLIWVSPQSGTANDGFQNASAAWALATGPAMRFWLPTGPGETYALLGLANDYAPQYADLLARSSNSIDLATDPALGLYVPVIAFGNAQVAAIAQSGDGSLADPYVISYAQSQPISSLFGVFDLFTEPLYPGLLLSGVTAHVVIQDPPDLYIRYTASEIAGLAYNWGLVVPPWNYLPMEIYDSSNISIVGAHEISGWFPAFLTGFLMASLFLSNDSHVLVAHNAFSSMGSAMAIVDPFGNSSREDNTVFGNTFRGNALDQNAKFNSSLYVVLAFNTTYTGPPAVGGLGVFSSGNTIYDNLFATPIGAYSPPQNPLLSYVFDNDLGYQDYASVAAQYTNSWNIALEPANYVRMANGFALTGSIVGAPFQGGNVWSTWNGSLPYTDEGLIVGGGDRHPVPLPGSGFYAIVFEASGLPSGTPWSVTVDGKVHTATRPIQVVYAPTGEYAYSVAPAAGLTPHPRHGSVDLTGNHLVRIEFGS